MTQAREVLDLIEKIEKPVLDAEAVERLVESYSLGYPELADAIEMYGEVMLVQLEALERIECDVEFTDGLVEARFLELKPVLEPGQPSIDPAVFRETVGKISAVVADRAPGGFSHVEDLLEWEGLSDGRLEATREAVLEGEDPGLPDEWGDDRETAKKILWEALAPFYMSCGRILQSLNEPVLWLRGVCPVCGSPPLIGQFRQEDGLWLLECSLCHSWWYVHRADCPFCSRPSGRLEFLFLEGEKDRRVQYCSECRTYVKTIDLREGDAGTLLPLEDIVTAQLDEAAAVEGLKPPGAAR